MSIRTEPCLCLDDPCQECCDHMETECGHCLDCAKVVEPRREYEGPFGMER